MLSFTFCYVGFLHFGQVHLLSTKRKLILGRLNVTLNLYWLATVETEQGVALAILRGVIDFKREPWPQISESAKSLVKQMLDPDPKKRLTAQQVLGMY